MERLTKWIEEGRASFVNAWTADGVFEELQRIVNRLASYEDTGLTPEECLHGRVIANDELIDALQAYQDLGDVDHLRKLVEAEKEGRLVELPEKTVFELTWDAGPNCDLSCPVIIDGQEQCDFCDHGELCIYETECRQDHISVIGKTVFLTLEEAEAAMKEREL